MDGESSLKKLTNILEKAIEAGASDIHLTPEIPVLLRVDGALVPMSEDRTESSEIEGLLAWMLTEEQKQRLAKIGELEFAYSMAGLSRLRVSIFRQQAAYAMEIRLLSAAIPTPEELGIPEAIVQLTEEKSGLVLVTGTAGCGKSTTLAALIEVIAESHAKSILTLEEPIEYLFGYHKSLVVQREIGCDSLSYPSALRSALRQDPDVILLGEMRDVETMSMALHAAETGHLVFSVLHTNNTTAAVARMIEVFPVNQQQQIRVQLSEVLRGVVAQQLLPKQKEGGRVAAFEVMLSNPNISNVIRENKLHNLSGVIQAGSKEGMQLMDDAIYDLYLRSAISSDTAIAYAQDSYEMKQKVQLF